MTEVPLLFKSMAWFLYDRDLRHERFDSNRSLIKSIFGLNHVSNAALDNWFNSKVSIPSYRNHPINLLSSYLDLLCLVYMWKQLHSHFNFLLLFLLLSRKGTKLVRKFTGGQLYRLDTGQKLNVLKTFKGRPGHHLNVLCTFTLRSVPYGMFWLVFH